MPEVRGRRRRYIISRPPNRPLDHPDVSFDDLANELDDIVRELSPTGSEEPGDAPRGETVVKKLGAEQGEEGVYALVAHLTDQEKETFAARHPDRLRIEEDQPLAPFSAAATAALPGGKLLALANVAPLGDVLEFMVVVRTAGGDPVPRARVVLEGAVWDDTAVTDSAGRATLVMFGESLQSLRSITVRPAQGLWSRRIDAPHLSDTSENTITLQPLTASTEAQSLGWGAAALGLDGLLESGPSVRVAIIDSGLAASHDDLEASEGFDFAEDVDDPETAWQNDDSGHGTHVAGTCGAIDNELGVRGLAPGASLIGLRIFPDARVSKLIQAIDWCIRNNIDVVNMSLGSASRSDILEERLEAARDNGIVLVAAAGNNGGDVHYPAAYDAVLAVAAIGKRDTFPEDSLHHDHFETGSAGEGGYFPARFTCRGDAIDFCAPGVAIVSAVPPNGYSAWDGTSMASPHVAGFLARLLQINHDIRSMPRTGQRVDVLVAALRDRCTDIGLPKTLQGDGLPRMRQSDVIGSEGGEQETPDLARVAELLQEAIDLIRADRRNGGA